MGFLDPSASDGCVIFFLPWQGNTIAGTTDSPAEEEREPCAPEEEIRWIREQVRRYLSPDIEVHRGDVLSVWSSARMESKCFVTSLGDVTFFWFMHL